MNNLKYTNPRLFDDIVEMKEDLEVPTTLLPGYDDLWNTKMDTDVAFERFLLENYSFVLRAHFNSMETHATYATLDITDAIDEAETILVSLWKTKLCDLFSIARSFGKSALFDGDDYFLWLAELRDETMDANELWRLVEIFNAFEYDDELELDSDCDSDEWIDEDEYDCDCEEDVCGSTNDGVMTAVVNLIDTMIPAARRMGGATDCVERLEDARKVLTARNDAVTTDSYKMLNELKTLRSTPKQETLKEQIERGIQLRSIQRPKTPERDIEDVCLTPLPLHIPRPPSESPPPLVPSPPNFPPPIPPIDTPRSPSGSPPRSEMLTPCF